MNVREVDPSLLDHRAVTQHASATTTTPFTAPGIFHKVSGAVGLFQTTADLVLQLQQEGLDLGHIRFAHLVSSQPGSSPDPIIVMSPDGLSQSVLPLFERFKRGE